PSAVLTPAPHPDAARWLPGALFNAAESALTGHDPDGTALIWAAEGSPADLKRMSLGELGRRCARAAESFRAAGLVPGDACALVLPMGPEAVIAYLGLILAGCAAVSVAESFSAAEIAARLRISKARAVVTQTALTRGGRSLPLYTRVCEAEAPRCIVLGDKAAANGDAAPLRPGDLSWEAFLELGSARAAAQAAQVRGLATPADSTINVLFSSGTTGEPKAIPFTHTTTLRCGTDAHFCQDVRAGDAVCWPTSMGWMMGPWLVFAALYNGAAVAMFEGAPTSREFGEFVQAARVNVLGLVPSIVKAWRASNCMHGLDWSALRAFSSTGEASAPQDCLWLSARAGYKPVVEYCGGTEIGGGFLSCSPLQPQAPSTFTTPTMGMVPVLLPDAGEPSPHGDAAPMEGELTIVAPALGTAQRLLNRDHAEVYFEGMPSLVPGGPPLRRHGDRFERLPGGAYRARGRSDDTMNLGGIKTSSLELENAILAGVSWVREAAAVAAPPPGGGPDRLEVFVVGDQKSEAPEDLRAACQQAVSKHLNPLFKVHAVRVRESLPRNAANKLMRRLLRDEIQPRAKM
ncbi:AMP-binding enzyme, partial [Helicosporidium sp. ATCC 50920]